MEIHHIESLTGKQQNCRSYVKKCEIQDFQFYILGHSKKKKRHKFIFFLSTVKNLQILEFGYNIKPSFQNHIKM